MIKRIISTSLYRNSLFLVADTGIASALGFLFWMLAARLYSASDVGSGSAIISAINLLTSLGSLGLTVSLIRFLPRAVKPRELINSVLTAIGLLSLLSAVIFVIGLQFWSPALLFIRHSSILLPTFIIITLLIAVTDTIDSVYIAKRKAKFMLFQTITLSLLKILLLVAMAYIFHSFGIVTSWGLALIFIFGVSIFLFLPRVQPGYRPMPTLNIAQLKNISRYSLFSYVYALLSQAPSMILPLMVVNTLGTDSNAYFYIAWTVSGMLSAIPWAVSRALFAEGSHSEKTLQGNMRKSVKFTFFLLIPSVAIFVLAAKWILLAFGSGYSTNALPLLWVLCLANLPRAVNLVYVGLLRAQDRLTEMVFFQVLVTGLILGSSIWSIQRYGIMGVGYVWLVVHGIVAIAIIFRLRSLLMSTSRVKNY